MVDALAPGPDPPPWDRPPQDGPRPGGTWQSVGVPSNVFIEFEADGPVPATAARLHAAWGEVLDLPRGVTPERAARHLALAARPPHDLDAPKPYCPGQMNAGHGMIGVELRVLDDRLLDTLSAWAEWGGVLPIGDGGPRTATLIATGMEVLEHASWEEIAVSDGATTWELAIISPLVMRSRGRAHTDLSSAAIATSLSSRWRQWDPDTAPWLPEREQFSQALATVDRTRPVQASLGTERQRGSGGAAGRTIEAREGQLRISGVDGAEATRVFSQLMALARFTNIGSYANYGMGVVDVEVAV